MKKRFLLLIDNLQQGGAERQLTNLAIQLKQTGNDIRLIKFYNGDDFYSSDLEKNCITTEVCLSGKSRLKRPFHIIQMVNNWNPDAVICYKDGTSMAACLARILKKFNLIVSERNTTQKIGVKERVKFFLYRFADHIVPNSFSQAEFIDKFFPKLSKKVKVITNTIDTTFFSPSNIVNNSESISTIVTMARVVPQKNVFTYLEAISIIKKSGIKAHFKWYGRYESEEYFEEIKQKIKDLEIEDMVSFCGASKDVLSVYRNAQIFLLPSKFEGFPNVLCEAMACGLPSIATKVSDCPRILIDNRFLPSPDSPKEIASAIEAMLALSSYERIKIGEENRRRIEKICSPTIFTEEYMKLS